MVVQGVLTLVASVLMEHWHRLMCQDLVLLSHVQMVVREQNGQVASAMVFHHGVNGHS